MKLRNLIFVGLFGILGALGIFVNSLFLLAAVFSLCGLMHLFGGHDHGGNSHTHTSPIDEKDKTSR